MVVGAYGSHLDPKVHVALRVRDSGMLIIGFVDTGNSDNWWPVWVPSSDPRGRVLINT